MPTTTSKRSGAVAGASLVLVVVHVNLLIGDMALLEAIVKGTDETVAKAGRVLYLINRSDELGTDPTSAPGDYLLLRRRKVEELIAALASRGITIDPCEAHALAGDPFGVVGSRMDVTRQISMTTVIGMASTRWFGLLTPFLGSSRKPRCYVRLSMRSAARSWFAETSCARR